MNGEILRVELVAVYPARVSTKDANMAILNNVKVVSVCSTRMMVDIRRQVFEKRIIQLTT